MADDGLDAVVYDIYTDAVLGSSSLSDSAVVAQLEQLRAACFDIVAPFTKDYIWQHQAFNLELSSTSLTSSRRPSHSQAEDFGEDDFSRVVSSPTASVPHLSGKTQFGDNIEDEWFVVYLLYEISRKLHGVSITVRDGDGEFLLIEAAYAIPRWLKPDNSWNRVFIRQGSLHLLPLSNLPVKPSVSEALEFITSGKSKTKASDAAQASVLRRIEDYPKKAQRDMHRVRVTVPLPVAQILKHEPQLVSLAVEAFYRRDIDCMKAASRMQKFLPKQADGQTEMVDVVVCMSRAMYAQLIQQVFQAPRTYPMPPLSSSHFKDAEIGMKLTCGFEMLYSERSTYEAPIDSTRTCTVDASEGVGASNIEVGNSNRREEIPGSDVGWQVFRASLENRGYFRGLLEGSREHRQLLQAAVQRYYQTKLFKQVSSAMLTPIQRIHDILSMPHTRADFSYSDLQQTDDESWLYDGEVDLKNAILERQREMEAYEAKSASRKESSKKHSMEGDSQGQPVNSGKESPFDPVQLVQSMNSFVSKLSSYEGAELPNDEEVSVNMSRFMKELESALGLKEMSNFPPHTAPSNEFDSSASEMDFDESGSEISDDEMPWQDMPSGDFAAASSAGNKREADNKKKFAGIDGFFEEYSEALDRELNMTSLAKSFDRAEHAAELPETTTRTEVDGEDQDVLPVDIDVNLVTSLLQSYRSQQGMPGPASNLLGAMGIDLPDLSEDKPDRTSK